MIQFCQNGWVGIIVSYCINSVARIGWVSNYCIIAVILFKSESFVESNVLASIGFNIIIIGSVYGTDKSFFFSDSVIIEWVYETIVFFLLQNEMY